LYTFQGGNTVAIEKGKLIDMYRTIVQIRRFEERAIREQKAGNIFRHIHTCIGEEAIAVGACANLRADDYVTGTHRGHRYMIAKGGQTDRLMAELYGKKTGYCKGKGGSMHIAGADIGMLGNNGIVGAGITIATGAALSAKMRGTDQVAVCFFGDGAANTGRFHEGINLGALWKLPAIYICENNLYAISMPQSRSMNITNIADRAAAYGIPGVVVDGNDVIAVYEAVGEAVARARRGESPTLIECKTYRLGGHFEGDPCVYRSKEEVKEWWEKDPVRRCEEQLIKMGVLTEKEAGEIDRGVLEEMDKAAKFAEESPFPDPEEALEDVYA